MDGNKFEEMSSEPHQIWNFLQPLWVLVTNLPLWSSLQSSVPHWVPSTPSNIWILLTLSSRGSTVTSFLVLYGFGSFFGGYSSGGYYARNLGKKWKTTMVFTAFLFPGVCVCIGSFLNFVAVSYGSLAAIPFWTAVVFFAMWLLFSVPMAVVGTVVGRNWNGTPNNPCRITPVPKPIPEKKW
jgi:hypothetical protein